MRTRLNPTTPEDALAHLLDALEPELVDALDEEILEAAEDLGMKPMMKGSAAFFGLHSSPLPQWSDFFESEELKAALLRSVDLAAAIEKAPKHKAGKPGPKPAVRIERKNPPDK